MSLETNHKPIRVMIVDDELDVLKLYEYVSGVEDIIIVIQTGGLCALNFLDKIDYHIDAVVCDLSMPDMDGLTLTKEIRRNEQLRAKSVPIKLFWLTGWDLENDDTLMQAKKDLSVEGYFLKPQEPVAVIRDVKISILSTTL